MQTNISQIDSYLGIDVAKEKITDKPIEPTLIRRPAADYRAVNDALDLILKSKNPIILAGNGTVRKRA